ncbi:hypothetical protein EOD41_07540 [Mucilaginibacter limnophilus]|uniref:DUF5672 domain-containing protein n=1 Tax=Mucilaginibacter limnophilus TaxID=1932778 RepID=A0A3S2UQ91_9SPHI|nr:DUF5672 family protein [Mucilaginibacter limnophilus]RVU01802.1 hypothetical protein EOD41_07540 [Mucilaginibacter limnophilus]
MTDNEPHLQTDTVAVLIPFYKGTLTHLELVALQQCFSVLSTYPIIAVKPQSLILPETSYTFNSIVSFPDDYFTSVESYNRLMLSAEFYSAFLKYDYVLIHQLDAFVFRDEIVKWCGKDIDYVGAPWLLPRRPLVSKAYIKAQLKYYQYKYFTKHIKGITELAQLEKRVGNGGLSLRKVARLFELCSIMQPQIDIYNKNTGHGFNEDVFWSIEVKRHGYRFNIPPFKEALQFAFEIAPERARLLNNGELPFACHAWDINIDYWRPIFKQYGYTI